MAPGKHLARGAPEQAASAGGRDQTLNRPADSGGARRGRAVWGWSDVGEELVQQARGVVGGQGLNGEPF